MHWLKWNNQWPNIAFQTTPHPHQKIVDNIHMVLQRTGPLNVAIFVDFSPNIVPAMNFKN